jgi:hypothetical protein
MERVALEDLERDDLRHEYDCPCFPCRRQQDTQALWSGFEGGGC